MTDETRTLVMETGRTVPMRIVQKQLRGELCVEVTAETHVQLETIHSAFVATFGDTLRRGSIVELAIRDLWEKISEEVRFPPIKYSTETGVAFRERTAT